MLGKIKSGFDKIVSYPHWQNIGAIVAVIATVWGGVNYLLADDNEKNDIEGSFPNSKNENCDKPFVYVKGSVSFDRDTKKPEDISALKISFKGDTEECSYDVSIEDDLSYFVKADKCKGGEKIKFSILNDGLKLGSNSIHSSTCKTSPIRIY